MVGIPVVGSRDSLPEPSRASHGICIVACEEILSSMEMRHADHRRVRRPQRCCHEGDVPDGQVASPLRGNAASDHKGLRSSVAKRRFIDGFALLRLCLWN